MSPLLLAALVAVPAAHTGAGVPEGRSVDPTTALRDEVAALWVGLDVGGDAQAIGARVDELVAELPAAPLAERAASVELTQAAEALMELRTRVLVADTPLPSGSRGEFLLRVAPGAMLSDRLYGIPASVTLAQAILESGWGRSAPGYNLFGMKGEGPAGSTVRRVVEYHRGRRGHRNHPFRAYHSYAESMADHARALARSERYAAARACGDDPVAFARALRGKYATDPRYDKKLMELAEAYDLFRFDWAEPVPAVAEGGS